MRCFRVLGYAENEPQGASRGCLSLAFPQRGTFGRSAAIQTRYTQRVPNGLRTNRSHRAGYTLVFFAMLMFALMGLAALVIDVGFARLTQRQMQTAVDSAAVEGLRGKGTRSGADRQKAAREIAGWHFDDDLDAAFDDGAFDTGSGQFGAGPVVDFTGGAGDPALVASQTMSVDPASPVYKPEFMDGTPSASGFQVAMLRGGTGIPDADVYSVGPSLPYLFARGSMINRQLIQDGITVRATGVADTRPATAVGVDTPGVAAGAQRFALREATWSLLPVDDGDPMTDNSMVVTVDGVNLGSTATPMRRLGEMITLSATPEAASGYVAIFDDVQGTNRVIGFGLARITVESPTEVRISSLCVDGGIIATENATAILGLVSPEVIGLSESEQAELLMKNRDLDDADVVFVPVSVR